MATYSQSGDMLLGEIPPSSTTSTDKYVQDAADEIDSKLGFRYVTPLVLTNAPRPVQLLVKRISNLLASGRYVLAVASPQEQPQLHAYGLSLVREATDALDKIATGEIELPGVELMPTTDQPTTAPMIANKDDESSVDAFYDRVANPNYYYPYPHDPNGYGYAYPLPPAGGMVR